MLLSRICPSILMNESLGRGSNELQDGYMHSDKKGLGLHRVPVTHMSASVHGALAQKEQGSNDAHSRLS